MKRSWTVIAVLLVVLILAAVFILIPRQPERDVTPPTTKTPTIVRIALTPYPDTSLFLYGKDKGYFAEAGIDLQVKNTTWNQQIEFVTGGGVDVCLGTVDDLVAKTKSLTTINRRVLFAVPVWLFEGTNFFSRGDIQSLDEIRKSYPEPEARTRFLRQLQGKIIAVPEGGNYDRAIRAFIASSGLPVSTFRFVNTQLETGINGLSDRQVGLAAAGAFERPEALRRGYKVALTSSDLGIVVVTGFLVDERFYRQHPRVVSAFAKAWYRTAGAALADKKGAYDTSVKYLSATGAKLPSFADFEKALGNNRIPTSVAESQRMFIDQSSPFYWKKAWDAAAKSLAESGHASEVPSTTDAFIAERVLAEAASQ